MPATSADNSILATGRPVRIPTPDDPSGFPNYYRNFRLTTLAECLRWGYEAGLKRDTDELGRARRPELGSELAAIIRGGLVADAERVGDLRQRASFGRPHP